VTLRNLLISLLYLLPLVACSSATDAGSLANGPDASPGSGGAMGTAAAGNVPSGGGSTNLNVMPDAGASSGEVMNGECAHQDFNLAQNPAEVLLVLDRSASMQEPPSGSSGSSKWDLVVPGVNEVITATNGTVSWGLKTFPEGEGEECIADSVTSAIPVPVAASNASAVTHAISATTPDGNGTPTADAIDAAVAYLKTLKDPNPKFILLATDGEPSCANDKKDTAAARTAAVKAIASAASAGFDTFVVGVATTKDSATKALNDMAAAGKMPRANSDSKKFYLASNKDELVKALTLITGQVSSCTFELTSAPPDPDNVAVHVNGMLAPRDPSHLEGWDYTGADAREVLVYGSWCDQIKGAAAGNTVNFILGCPGEVVH